MSDWRDLGPAADFAPGRVRAARVAGVRLAVGRTERGFFAVDGLCPHAGGVLGEGILDGDLLVCPLHAYAFDVRSGACADDESCRVRAYELRVEAGVLQVRLGR